MFAASVSAGSAAPSPEANPAKRKRNEISTLSTANPLGSLMVGGVVSPASAVSDNSVVPSQHKLGGNLPDRNLLSPDVRSSKVVQPVEELPSIAEDDDSWTHISNIRARPKKKADLAVERVKADATPEYIEGFVHNRCKKLSASVTVHRVKVFPLKEGRDTVCARLTVNQEDIPVLKQRGFWPGRLFCRDWVYTEDGTISSKTRRKSSQNIGEDSKLVEAMDVQIDKSAHASKPGNGETVELMAKPSPEEQSIIDYMMSIQDDPWKHPGFLSKRSGPEDFLRSIRRLDARSCDKSAANGENPDTEQ